MGKSSDVRSGWFYQHPKTTSILIFCVLFIPLDFLLGYRQFNRSYPDPSDLRRPHPIYHHGLVANFSGYDMWRSKYRVATNSLGMKDKTTRSVDLDSSQYRILFIGDSFTEGVDLPYERTFAGMIDAALEPSGIDVLNAGVVSYAPKLYYLKVKYLLEEVGLKIDELHVFIDHSDPQDEITYEHFESGSIDRQLGMFDQRSEILRAILEEQKMSVTNYSLTCRFFKHAILGIPTLEERAEAEVHFEHDFPWNRHDYLEERRIWSSEEEMLERWGRRGLSLCEQSMTQLLKLCRAHDVKMSVAVYPYPNHIRAGELDSPYVQFWRQFCMRENIEFLDFFPIFINGNDADSVIKRYFLSGDDHWDAAGHRKVADIWLERNRQRLKLTAGEK